MSKTNGRVFDLNSTLACKGVALLLLLWHHLFYKCPQYGPIVYETAVLSKVCVSIFVFLSGYGFSESIKGKTVGLFAFYKKRFVALYCNYWFIAAVFVTIGVFILNRSIESAFSRDPYSRFIVQMTGLHMFFYNDYGYNATWWYMSVIIPLILLFPFMYDLLYKYTWFLLSILVFATVRDQIYLSIIKEWILSFCIGIYFSQNNCFFAYREGMKRFGLWRFPILILLMVSLSMVRLYSSILYGTKIDWLFGLVVIFVTLELTSVSLFVQLFLAFLGRHLFNVFLFHTFIFHYYWSEFVYGFRHPLLIFGALLSVCICVSLILEGVKKFIGFYRLTQKLQNLKVPSSIEIPFRQDAPVET